MQTVILAAGEGKRCRPLTETTPKPLLPIANKPLLGHILDKLYEKGINEIIIIIGYLKEKIEQYLKEKYPNLNIKIIEENERKGTGYAVSLAENDIKEQFFLVINGDIYFDAVVLDKILSKFNETKESIIAAKELENVDKLGVLETNDDKVVRIHEKSQNPPSKLANIGLYVLNREIFDSIRKTNLSERGEIELTASLQIFIDEGKSVRYCKSEEFWSNISYPWDLLDANSHVLQTINNEIKGTVEEFVKIKENVFIGEGTVVKSGAYIEGPVIIGNNCQIGPNCYIRPATSIGENCKVGNGCEVKNSIVMKNTKIPHLSYVGDSILSENVNLGAGTIIANLRLDGENVKYELDGEKIDTKRRKFGAVISEASNTLINTVIMPGDHKK
jgi:bifunctional UDP-N-acetylglucosamine pyrophosphorylase/glucosamine-1-phosphate N-acetyltransferase